MANAAPQWPIAQVELTFSADGKPGVRLPRVEDAYYLRILVGAIPRYDNIGGGMRRYAYMYSQSDGNY